MHLALTAIMEEVFTQVRATETGGGMVPSIHFKRLAKLHVEQGNLSVDVRFAARINSTARLQCNGPPPPKNQPCDSAMFLSERITLKAWWRG